MTTTQALNIPYDEDSLSIEEQNELEDFCFELQAMLENKIKDMGLVIEEGFGQCITKFSQEELRQMEENYKKYMLFADIDEIIDM